MYNIDEYRRAVTENIFKSFENDLEKGKKADVGEIREWKGKKVQKQSDGTWKELKGNKAVSDKKNKTKHKTTKRNAEKLVENSCFDCDETLFEILFQMPKDEYKEMYRMSDAEIERKYKEAEYQFSDREFKDVTDSTSDIEDFEENAEFGEKAYFDGVTYYKVRNAVEDMAYVIYFDENGNLMHL